MALTIKDKSGLLALNLGLNQIESKGVEYLSQAKWSKLTHLYLKKNNISSEGVKWICKSNFPQLKIFSLCAFVIFR